MLAVGCTILHAAHLASTAVTTTKPWLLQAQRGQVVVERCKRRRVRTAPLHAPQRAVLLVGVVVGMGLHHVALLLALAVVLLLLLAVRGCCHGHGLAHAAPAGTARHVPGVGATHVPVHVHATRHGACCHVPCSTASHAHARAVHAVLLRAGRGQRLRLQRNLLQVEHGIVLGVQSMPPGKRIGHARRGEPKHGRRVGARRRGSCHACCCRGVHVPGACAVVPWVVLGHGVRCCCCRLAAAVVQRAGGGAGHQQVLGAGRPRVRGRAQLRQRVREEADGAVAIGPVLAQLCAVAGGVQPALKHAVCVGARVATHTEALLVVRAGDGAIAELPGVAPPRILCGVRERACPPVVRKALAAPHHLEPKHAPVICGELWLRQLAG
mmetsp:Transcript_14015/g.34550  ORF Transcript_14015/g.34550 Transcript_14015/m.34550 type:complete len:381 (+) Transcript_14015:1810-2952(+)